MSGLESDPVQGFQVMSEAVAAPHAKAPTPSRAHNRLLWQPPTLARYRFGDRGMQVLPASCLSPIPLALLLKGFTMFV